MCWFAFLVCCTKRKICYNILQPKVMDSPWMFDMNVTPRYSFHIVQQRNWFYFFFCQMWKVSNCKCFQNPIKKLTKPLSNLPSSFPGIQLYFLQQHWPWCCLTLERVHDNITLLIVSSAQLMMHINVCVLHHFLCKTVNQILLTAN